MKYWPRAIVITLLLLVTLLGAANTLHADYPPYSLIDFGLQQVNTTSAERLVFTLPGYSNAQGVIQITVTGNAFRRGPGSTCPGQAILPIPGCTLTVVFEPTSAASFTGKVTFHQSACTLQCPPDQTWDLKGTGFQPTPPPPPAPPTGLVATAVSINRINLTWNDNSANESGFTVERATVMTGPFTQIVSLGANVRTYADTTLIPATTYYYRVRAFGAGGPSSYSNIGNAKTFPPPPPKPCDVNLDAQIDIRDVQITASQAIGVIPMTPEADINHDGVVNILDVQRVVNATLGLVCNTN